MLAPTSALLNPAAFSATVERSIPPASGPLRDAADRTPTFADTLSSRSARSDRTPESPGERGPAGTDADRTAESRGSSPHKSAETAPTKADRARAADADADAETTPPDETNAPADADSVVVASPTVAPEVAPEVPPGSASAAVPSAATQGPVSAPNTTGVPADPAADHAVLHADPASPQQLSATPDHSVGAIPAEASAAAAAQSNPGDTSDTPAPRREDATRAEAAARAAASPDPASPDPASADLASQRVTAADHAALAPDSGPQPNAGPTRFLDALARTGDPARAALTTPQPAEAGFGAQVSRGLESALRAQTGAVTLRLSPASLGALRIDLRVEGGHVAAQFQASTREAHDLLNTQLSSLRAALEAKGLTVRSVEVQPPTPGEESSAARDWGAGSSNTGSSDAGAHGFGAHAEGGAGGSTFGGREDLGRFDARDAHTTQLGESGGDAPARPGVLDAVA